MLIRFYHNKKLVFTHNTSEISEFKIGVNIDIPMMDSKNKYYNNYDSYVIYKIAKAFNVEDDYSQNYMHSTQKFTICYNIYLKTDREYKLKLLEG